MDESFYQDMVKYGRRNIAMLTIAPTGTVSICTQTTSGIEPVFMVSYKRRRKVNPNDKNAKVSFTDNDGNSFEEYNVFHPKFITWLEVNGYDVEEVKNYNDEQLQEIINKSPYYKATANDIDWVSKVKMQGEMQKWVDHSISVTVNIPAETTEELVSQIYLTAWECGCKGMTIYRDGSRTGVLVSNKSKEDKKVSDNDIIETHSPVRPKTLECDVVRFQNNYEKWIAFVGKINNKPYEIFLGQQDDFYLPPFVETAWIIKNKDENNKTRYDLQYVDRQGFKVTMEGLSRSFNKEFWNYAKLISGILRHGMPINSVVNLIQNLNVDEDNINTWKNGIARALKRYIPDGTKVDKEVCPTCGDPLVYEDGCKHCKNCGYSKCG